VFHEDAHETLDAAEDSAVDHHRAARRTVRGSTVKVFRAAVLQVEPLRQLEVELEGRALEGALECVLDMHIDLGTVERAVAWVELPLSGELAVEHPCELLQTMSARFEMRYK